MMLNYNEMTKCCASVVGATYSGGFLSLGDLFVPDEVLSLQYSTTVRSVLTDCQDVADCPEGEECQSRVLHGSTRHVCVCPAGHERDANTQRCMPVSKSGQYDWY